MLIQSDYHIHASFYRVKGPGAEPGPTAAEQLAAARGAGDRRFPRSWKKPSWKSRGAIPTGAINASSIT